MLISDRLRNIKPSGVRRIFDLARQMKDPINLSIGEPDFDIPEPLKEEGIAWIKKGFNKYTATQETTPACRKTCPPEVFHRR
jgi:aspartate aminotransferase/aminotransferase